MYPGKIEPFLEYQEERREQADRDNASVIAKQKQLESFIAKNRAGAQHRQPGPLETKTTRSIEVERNRPGRKNRLHSGPRRRTAARALRSVATDLAIGYPDHRVAAGIHIEIEHQQRTAIVG